MNGYLGRIAELEDALVEERANRMIQVDDCTQNQEAADFHHRCICEFNVKKCPIERWWLDRAKIALRAEDKIGPDAKPRVWQITEERVGLLEYCLETLLDAPDIEEIPGPGHSIEVLRAMLEEAGQE